jgi:hypothetical protein
MLSTRPAARRQRGVRADLVAGGAALGLVGLATAIGFAFQVRLHGDPRFPGAPTTFGEWPVLGEWLPHLGPGTPLAVLIAVAAVAWGPPLAERLPWRRALAAGYLLAVLWTLSLALVDGWSHGVATRLTTDDEYVSQVPGITDIPTMLRTFTDRILDGQPDSWITHVAGHPPGATLIFVWLDRIGLGGGTPAALLCVLISAATAAAVPVTISALGRRDLARAALPFVALLPGAVWMGVSADALFAGVTATGIALLALGGSRESPAQSRESPAQSREFAVRNRELRRWNRGLACWNRGLAGSPGVRAALCLGAGVLLGFGIFLSYGLVLMSPIALAVIWATRNWHALVLGVLGALAVVAAFALAGFWWLDGYHLVVERYHQSIAEFRPYAYWVWADLACLVLATGPAAAAGLRRAAPHFHNGLPGRPPAEPVVMLVRAAALAVLTAALSGLSKAEVERIWLPFAVWLVAGAALLPASTRRGWLAAGAAVALPVNHLLLTNW